MLHAGLICINHIWIWLITIVTLQSKSELCSSEEMKDSICINAMSEIIVAAVALESESKTWLSNSWRFSKESIFFEKYQLRKVNFFVWKEENNVLYHIYISITTISPVMKQFSLNVVLTSRTPTHNDRVPVDALNAFFCFNPNSLKTQSP